MTNTNDIAHEMTWEQSGDGYTADLRIEYRPNGEVVLHDLKGNTEQTFGSEPECLSAFQSLLQNAKRKV